MESKHITVLNEAHLSRKAPSHFEYDSRPVGSPPPTPENCLEHGCVLLMNCSNNDNISVTEDSLHVDRDYWMIGLFILLFLSTCLLNMAVMATVRYNRKLMTVVNVYVFSLAIADFMVGSVVNIGLMVHSTFNEWPLGVITCDIWILIDFSCTTVSMLHMCLIAHDRTVVMTAPISGRVAFTSTRRAIYKSVAAWFLGCLVWVPIITYEQKVRGLLDNRNHCLFVPTFPLTLIQTVFVYYIPLIFIAYCYVRIILMLNRSQYKSQVTTAGSETHKTTENSQGKPKLAYEDPQKGSPDDENAGWHNIAVIPEMMVDGMPCNTEKTELQSTDDGVRCSQNSPDSNGQCGMTVLRECPGEAMNGNIMTTDVSPERKSRDRSFSSDMCQLGVTGQLLAGHVVSTPRRDSNTEIRVLAASSTAKAVEDAAKTRNSRVSETNGTSNVSVNQNGPGGPASWYSRRVSIESQTDVPFRRDSGSTDHRGSISSQTYSPVYRSQHPEELQPPAETDLADGSIESEPKQRRFATSSFMTLPALSAAGSFWSLTSRSPVRRSSAMSRSRRVQIRATRSLTVVMLAFVICWVPYCILWPIVAYCLCVPSTLLITTYWLAYINSTINPLLYFICNVDFRQGFLRMMNVKHRNSSSISE